LRVRVPSRRRDLAWFTETGKKLAVLSGVEAVDISELSAGILIVHRRGEIDSLLAAVQEQGLFRIAAAESRKPATLRQGIAAGFRTVNRRVGSATGGSADLWDVVFLGLAGFGVYQLFRGNVTSPMWYIAFWYAFNIYMKAESGDASGE
jgi:hypothetical protein